MKKIVALIIFSSLYMYLAAQNPTGQKPWSLLHPESFEEFGEWSLPSIDNNKYAQMTYAESSDDSTITILPFAIAQKVDSTILLLRRITLLIHVLLFIS